jgi:uncharacterized protein YkwD
VTRLLTLLAVTAPMCLYACAGIGAPAVGPLAHQVRDGQRARTSVDAMRTCAKSHKPGRSGRRVRAVGGCQRRNPTPRNPTPRNPTPRNPTPRNPTPPDQRRSGGHARADSQATTPHAAHVSSPVPPAPAPNPTPAALAQASAIAGVLATTCQNVQLMPELRNLPQVRAAVLCLINRQRAQHGETPLTANPKLEQAAESHAQEMVSADYFAHVSPSGLTPLGRVRATGYIPSPLVGYVIGENLAWGTLSLATPEAIVAAWIASPGHLANILEGQYRDTGVAIVAQAPAALANSAAGATYAQEFGVIIR